LPQNELPNTRSGSGGEGGGAGGGAGGDCQTGALPTGEAGKAGGARCARNTSNNGADLRRATSSATQLKQWPWLALYATASTSAGMPAAHDAALVTLARSYVPQP
jgi:hypothetical protein